MNIHIRPAEHTDLSEMIHLFVDTVTHINATHYNPEQIQAWVYSTDREERWKEKIDEQYFIVAEVNNAIAGLGSISSDGYLDLLYVHKDAQRKGIAQAIMNELNRHALEKGYNYISSDVSITARPFFEKNAFTVVEEQSFERNGIMLTNYKMSKGL